MWAYRYMRGWHASKNVHSTFKTQDLEPLRNDACLEATVKRRLKERFQATDQVIVLIGSDNTLNAVSEKERSRS